MAPGGRRPGPGAVIGSPTRRAAALALAGGALGLAAVLALVVFYAWQVPRSAPDAAPPALSFGLLNDGLTLAAALALLVLVPRLPGALGLPRGRGVALASALGGLGAAGVVVVMLLYLSQRISLLAQATGYLLCLAPLGGWRVALCRIGRRAGAIPAGLARFGLVLGAAELAAVAIFLALGGPARVAAGAAPDPREHPVLIFGVLGGGLLGYAGAPLWTLGLGRVLLWRDRRGVTLPPRSGASHP